MDRNKATVVGVLLITGCAPTLPAATAYDAASDIGTKSQLAQRDLQTCKADQTKCEPLEQDLKAINETSDGLKSKAVSAGFDPGLKPATPAIASTGK